MTLGCRLRRRLADARGYTLIEMVIVMAMMGVVMGGITTLFVNGTNAEVDQNNRFQAQLNARLSLDKIRREVHAAACITLSGTKATVNGVDYYPTMTEKTWDSSTPPTCSVALNSWCTAAVNGATNRFAIYRQSGSTCSASTGTKFADYLTIGTLFAYNTTSGSAVGPTGVSPKLTVDIPVNRKPATRSQETYELKDDIVLRNGTRG